MLHGTPVMTIRTGREHSGVLLDPGEGTDFSSQPRLTARVDVIPGTQGGITMPAAVIRSKTLHDEKAMWACHPGPCGRQGIAVRTLSREVVSPTWAQDSDALGS